MNRNIYLIFIITLGFALSANAQKITARHFKILSPEECQGSQDKKAQKLLEAGKDRKTEKEDRIEALRKAVEQDPDCAEAHYWLGLELLRSAISRGSSFNTASDEIAEAVRICPEFHFDPYYFLGAIALGKKEYAKAVEYYKKYYEISGSHMDPLDDELEAEIKLDYEFAKFFADAYANPVPFNPQPVVGVCTELDEFLPLITPDNEHMLVTRQYKLESEVKQTSFTSTTETLFKSLSSQTEVQQVFQKVVRCLLHSMKTMIGITVDLASPLTISISTSPFVSQT